MSAFIFKISCPRCETEINIYLGKHEYYCSRCQFQVVIEDKEGLLQAYKTGAEADLEFSESAIKGAHGGMDTGLRLKFSRGSAAGVRTNTESQPIEMTDQEMFDNKTANTQVINLTFDPAKYLDEIEERSAHSAPKKARKKKIALSKVIKYAEKARPALPSSKEKLIRNVVLLALALLLVGAVLFIVGKVGG